VVGVLSGAFVIAPLAAPQAAQAATHVDNPYVGATQFVNPSWAAEVNGEAAKQSDSSTAAKMHTVATYSTAVWMDQIAAIDGSNGTLGLAGFLDSALSQQQGSTPEVIEVVVYDLPGRDCASLASNGELPATDAGLQTYETQYIDPLTTILANPKYASLRIVAIVEPDSLPNIVTNQSIQACATATPYYEAGVEYALNKLHAIPNVYNYLDSAHSGWLGWPNNSSGAASEYAKVAKATTAGVASIDGFITDTANYTPIKEPYMTATQQVGGQPVESANFYQWNPDIDETDFAADMYSHLTAAGFPSTIGMLIDTSRDGWGGPQEPTGPSTSTDLNTFVNASKIDLRQHRGLWCNQNGAGLGMPPTVTPAGYSNAHLDAFVWVKPPGESDGTSAATTNNQGKKSDPFCDPTYTTSYGVLTNALPNSPLAGQWFPAQFDQLVANANPVPGGSSTGGDTQAPSVPSGVTVTGTTSSSVSLSWSASTDNVGVAGYDILRNGTQVGTSSTTSFSDTGLTASTAYSYSVKAFDAAGNTSAASTAVSATTTGASGGDTQAPSVPSGVVVAGTTSSSVSLSWSASTDNVGVSGYDVLRDGVQVGTSTTTSFSDTGLAASTAYSYSVKAFDAAGNTSAASVAVSATTSGGGGGSPGLSVLYKNNDSAAGDGQIKPGLELVNNGGSAVDLSTVSVRYYFTHDAGSTTFAYSCDYAAIGCGNVHGSFVSMASPSPTADTYLQLSFTGSLPAGANSGDLQNRINKSDWSNFDETNDYSYGTNTAYAPTSTVTVYVNGTLVAGTEPGGGSSSGGDNTAPSAPSGLAVTATTSSSVALSWSAATDNVGVAGYRVFRGATLVGSPTTTSFTDTGLTPSTAYSYTVKAVDAAGNTSPASNTTNATTAASSSGNTVTDCTPGPTQNGVTKVEGDEYRVQTNEWNSSLQQCLTIDTSTGAWSVSTANFNQGGGGAPATYPSIYKGCHWGNCTTANSGLPIQVSQIGSATSSWSTTQVSSGAYDVAYDIWTNTTPTTTGQPNGTELMIWLNSRGGVQPFGSQTATGVNVAGHTWNVWQGNQTSWKIISYVLSPGATSISNLDIKALMDDASARGSLDESNYLLDSEAGFEIWQGGQGLASNSYTFNVTTGGGGGDTQAPSAPSGLNVTGTTSSSVSLSWTASTDNVGVTGYQVFRGSTLVGSPTSTSFTDSGLTASTAYSYTVKAVDAAGNVSAASSAVSATTAGSSSGGGGCTASLHDDNDWGSGFTGTVTVTNTGTAATKGWKVTWAWGGNQQITNSWNATVTSSGSSVTAVNLGYNGAIAAGGNTTFGIQASYTGSNAAPTLTCTAS